MVNRELLFIIPVGIFFWALSLGIGSTGPGNLQPATGNAGVLYVEVDCLFELEAWAAGELISRDYDCQETGPTGERPELGLSAAWDNEAGRSEDISEDTGAGSAEEKTTSSGDRASDDLSGGVGAAGDLTESGENGGVHSFEAGMKVSAVKSIGQSIKFGKKGWSQEGIASWYGPKFHGGPTASGETYDMYSLTAAHRELPFNTLVRVTNMGNNRTVVVRINNRGPFAGTDRIIDISIKAAEKLGMKDQGLARVRIKVIEEP